MKQIIIWIIVLLFAGGIAYTRFIKPQQKLPDTSIFEKRIDSLNNEIELHNQKQKTEFLEFKKSDYRFRISEKFMTEDPSI